MDVNVKQITHISDPDDINDQVQCFRVCAYFGIMFCLRQVLLKYIFALQLSNFLLVVILYAVHLTCVYNLKVGCLHPVAWTRSGNPEPDLVHATGYKQPTLRYKLCS
jgi:hypothetical protein